MPWTTPPLLTVRQMTRDFVIGATKAKALVPNNPLSIMSDAMSGLAHLCLQYIDWLAKQLLPDQSEDVWLDRHGTLWLSNADGTRGRKVSAFASGTIALTGGGGTPVVIGTQWLNTVNGLVYETTESVTLAGSLSTPVPTRALDPGQAGNLDPGTTLAAVTAIVGLDGVATVIVMDGGADEEPPDELRSRVLLRIQEPPMGGDEKDYIQWTKAVNGVTRAWSYPNEMGIGTVTVRFMCDHTRASSNGFPNDDDVAAVRSYLDTVRPVTTKDFFVVSPIPFLVNITISNLAGETVALRAAIEASLVKLFAERATPGQTIYGSWLNEAISQAAGEDHHDATSLIDSVMPSPGHMPILGTIQYV